MRQSHEHFFRLTSDKGDLPPPPPTPPNQISENPNQRFVLARSTPSIHLYRESCTLQLQRARFFIAQICRCWSGSRLQNGIAFARPNLNAQTKHQATKTSLSYTTGALSTTPCCNQYKPQQASVSITYLPERSPLLLPPSPQP